MATDLVGRVVDSEHIAASVSQALHGVAKLLLLGDPGTGKTRLLALAGEVAAQRGFRVVAGSASAGSAAAGGTIVGRLVAPLLRRPGVWPASLRDRAEALVSGSAEPIAGGLALLAIVRRIARDQPLAILVDDLHSASRVTRETLTVLSRALSAERVALVFAARGPLPPSRFDADVPVWQVCPLRSSDASVLLDRQPSAPKGWWRGELLRHAGGNPLVLIELAAAASLDDGGYRLILPDRMRREHSRRIATLPEATRRVLLSAAAAEGADHLATVLAAAGAELAACAPAELAGLLTVTGDRAGFADPAVRLACYLGADFAERQRAHRALAAALPPDAERRHWHLALAADQPDEAAASALETAAAAAAGHGDHSAGAAALERAADASTDDERAARRYATAARQAALAGDHAWCRELVDLGRTRSADPDVLGRALAVEAQHRRLRDPSTGVLGEIRALLARGLADREAAFGLAFAAEVDVLVSGDPRHRAGPMEILAAAGELPARFGEPDVLFCRSAEQPVVLISGAISPRGGPAVGSGVPALEDKRDDVFVSQPLALGVGEWLEDRPSAAMTQLKRARHLLSRAGAATTCPFSYVVLLDALIECGLWREADELATEAETVAVAGAFPVLRRTVRAQVLSLLTRRGQADAALEQLTSWERRGPGGRMAECLVQHAFARAWAAAGDHARACEHFELTFEPGGDAAHFAWSYRAIAEFARSAAKADRPDAVLRVLERMERTTRTTPRRAALFRHAVALVSDPADPDVESALRAVATAKEGRERPYEHAFGLVDYADWLRTRRRDRDARPLLAAARDTFVRLGATRDAREVRIRLRATGVPQDGPDREAFESLTAQQQVIVKLAAEGLTNREIAARMGLSPRTVGSHLYQIYPKLGIVSRRQLHTVVPGPA
ncbi:LuxR C-terminal-related transcriptional regulator [Amycolatopsis sp. NPDC051903]|uniref:helix-turn-helix transcriptional regulator n=1 Tax=Amycolatopsis sp. NPDC051903 TaxID=3363936 RepID=UPI0037953B6A